MNYPRINSQPGSLIGEDPANTSTLPSWTYTNPSVLDRERDTIFFRSWQYAGNVHQLKNAGDYITANSFGESIIVIKGKDGEIRGFYNVCQHRAHQLLTGTGNVRSITCPYHAWAYQTDGRLRTARATEGMEDFNPRNYDLKSVRVEIFADNFVFYNLDPDAVSLAEQTGSMADDIRKSIIGYENFEYFGAVSAFGSEIQCNWKVLVDNYLECYHCSVAHPALTELIDMKFSTFNHGNWTHQTSGMGSRDNSAYKIADTETNDRVLFWWLYPNTTFNVLPGDPSNIHVSVYQPISPDRTRVWSHQFGMAGTTPSESRFEYRAKVIGPEDTELCEGVQRGLQSKGYNAGRLVFDPAGGENTEELLHTFHKAVAKALEI